ncbi:hypothetical protein [Paenibacillus aestuarii]|uniref:Carbohydrate ABC transporter permease n=1 Tax=Paenibacillus aestuarii TaxID=516965 RepID=A0ABW0KHP3_9BACL
MLMHPSQRMINAALNAIGITGPDFMNMLLITLPPFVLFIFFNKKIVAGMTAGSVKV